MTDSKATPPEKLARNFAEVRTRIRDAAVRAGRDPGDVTIVAVTKMVPVEVMRMLPAVGLTDIGENRVPAAVEKFPRAPPDLTWHMIGHLQRNKARRALEIFTIFHSVDSERLLRTLDRLAGEMEVAPEILLQVNISGEAQKQGLAPASVRSLLAVASAAEFIRVRGLMGMAHLAADPEETRPGFRLLAELLAEANREGWYREPLVALSITSG